ncbi:MAG TPA: glycosyltransferase family 4 protein [Flavisolibacter sp.]|nr:glycosyltransferase family 4 protein [Flavisolibacter sp.]
MKIAQVAPLYESVPPRLYGGTERVVHYLTEELVKLGHEVTLFASEDSITSASLIPICKEALRLNLNCEDSLAPHILEIQEVIERAQQFDIIHFHIDYLHFPFSSHLSTPHLTTLHGKLSIPELQMIYNKFNLPVVSISSSQRAPLPQANFVATIHHGLPEELHCSGSGTGGYLAFLGRISPEKGIDKAIEWAITANTPLKIAAKVDKADEKYFQNEIRHLLAHPLIEYIGEINEKEKTSFLGNARALLFPINWQEPFGMVLIEALACGTPVIAHPFGSVPEIITHGENGFLVNSTKEATAAIHKLSNWNRLLARQSFDKRFTAYRMALDYLRVYEKLIAIHQAEKKNYHSLVTINYPLLKISS